MLSLFPSLPSPQIRGSDVVIGLKMEEKLDIMFLHGGDFKKNAEGIMIYSPDNKACLGDLDTNTLDVFYIRNYHKELGYNDIKQCWWHVPGKGLENGLRNVNSDKEIREMVNCARTNEGLIDIYFEHTVSVPEVLEGDNTVVYLDDHGGEGCNAGIDTDVSPPLTQTHALVVAPPIPKVVPNTSCKSSPKKNKTSPRQSQPNHAKTANPSKTTKPLKKTNSPKATKPTKPTKLTKPTKISQPTKPSQNTKSDKSNKQKLSKRPSISKRPCTRSAARGFSSKVFNNEVPFDVSSDSSDSEEDSMFKPGPDEGSSSDSEATGNDPKTGSRIRRNMTHAAVGKRNISPLGKGKEKILHEDDGLVEEVSDAEVDLGFVGCVHEGVEDGLDPDDWILMTKPGKLKMKRRMDADENSGFGTKKPKVDPKLSGNTADSVHLKRQLGAFTCSYCGDKGHTKRGCKKKRDADAATAAAAAAAAAEATEKKKNDEVHPLPEHPVQQPQDDSGQADLVSNPQEIDLTQPFASEQEDSEKDPGPKRPSKLSPRRRFSMLPTAPTVNPLQGASSATSSKFTNLMQFIPTPGFKPPRKKN
ncbi:hypothetical protein Ahy_B03g068730 [Arachis hypogaea]|uniref:CCHC-type domain-containing protein n=1 Tax=Arachis hypogaea TaxID=3818 RepID=A0A445AAQ3_ARAHY|nr:hypothetical protein Ahy_B03g068730 [Arachis hypogaea]